MKPSMLNLKSRLAKPFAHYISKQVQKASMTAVQDQQRILNQLVKSGSATLFGKDHGLQKVKDYEGFKQAVPIRD
ncbi:MAG: GH3 family domain-containing protein, partial [Sediminibacterium sp.]